MEGIRLVPKMSHRILPMGKSMVTQGRPRTKDPGRQLLLDLYRTLYSDAPRYYIAAELAYNSSAISNVRPPPLPVPFPGETSLKVSSRNELALPQSQTSTGMDTN